MQTPTKKRSVERRRAASERQPQDQAKSTQVGTCAGGPRRFLVCFVESRVRYPSNSITPVDCT